jgi:hypothetical protein
MTSPDVLSHTLRRLTLEEIGYCRLFAAVALDDDEAAEWLRWLDAWDAFLRLDPATRAH